MIETKEAKPTQVDLVNIAERVTEDSNIVKVDPFVANWIDTFGIYHRVLAVGAIFNNPTNPYKYKAFHVYLPVEKKTTTIQAKFIRTLDGAPIEIAYSKDYASIAKVVFEMQDQIEALTEQVARLSKK